MSPLHSMERPPELAHCAKYGGTEERTECRLFASGDLRIFTILARWKFSYENRLVEISRDYREKIV